jgi:hypothetical protein
MIHRVQHFRRVSFVVAALCVILAAARADRVVAQSSGCPCSIWTPAATPANPAVTDGQPIEVGVKFRSDVNGFVTALRFYKGTANVGSHVGHLWSGTGALLAEATFTNESAAGWQEIALTPPVAITADTTYVASYHADSGFFAFDSGYFAASGVDSPPLHALRAGVNGESTPNGVFLYGASDFPTMGGANNYWVDLVLQTDLGPDTTPPVVLNVTPAPNATGVPLASTVTAAFSEAIDPSSLTSTFLLRDQGGAAIPATVSYNVGTRTATLATTAGLLAQTTYTATVSGGVSGVRDLAGNALASDVIWSFTTGAPTPPADEGPGGPILVISSSSNPFGRYYAEILRAEGLNEFTVTDISQVTPAILASYDVAILGEMPLTSSQVAMLTDWVSNGGNVIAMRPDKQLAGLLGLSDQSSTLANAYLQVNTTSAPGAGIVSDTMQFHGAADKYVIATGAGASTIATLFSDAATATANPAVTIASVGGGQAAAFTFDLARSIVYTRQGNPAWSGQERDGISPIRSDDLFFGAAGGDVQPDWVDLNKVAIPQADEQQRLLANLVLHLNRARKPLPRFWYLPRSAKAALVMTGDDHGNGGTVGRFNQYKGLSAPGCSVADWQCIRSTSYIYNGTPGMDDASSLGFVNDGFEVALHVTTNCADWTPATLATFYSQQIAQFHVERPSVPPLRTNRTHCIAWSDYVTQPKVELSNGIRLDANYYFYPPNWVQDRPGLFTGSAMPMRFADVDGTTIDVYQATTQMTDESGQTYPFTSDTLFDRALGPLGYYGVFTANMHTDLPTEQPSDAAVNSAISRGIPVVSAKQMLDWLEGRNGSSFGSVAFSSGVLTFTISLAAGSNGLTAMVPATAKGGALIGISRDGSPVSLATQVIKGVSYAFFDAAAGSYTATYAVDVTPPVISGVTATPGLGNTATITWTTDEPADSRVDFGLSASALTSHAAGSSSTTTHSVVLTGLAPVTTYFYQVTSADAAGNTAISAILSFAMPATQFAATDTTVADFSAGTTDGQEYIAQSADGEVILTPAAGSEFFGTALPVDWSSTAWSPGGTATVSSGTLVVDGARAGTIANFAAGRSLEFVAIFSGAPFQHVGFADTLDAAPWAMFSTFSGGGLFARANSGGASIDTPIAGSLLGSPHRFRIDWTPTTVVYSVDGAVVATHAIAIGVPLRPLVSDFSVGSGSVSVDWIRMTPYVAAGTFVSRVFDATQAVDWGGLSWTTETPAGTSAAFFARHGDSPVPDAGWSAFAPVAQPGGAIGGRSRYAQYRVDLASTDPNATPAVDDVTVGYALVPPNHAPVAVADSYNGTQDTPLTIAAPGVLANDTDADGDPLTAVLMAPPAHGGVVLSANGGFSYTPAAGFSGADSFTYKANDAKDDSAVATVTITIAATATPQTDVTVSGDQGTAKTTVKTATFSTTSGNELLLAFVSADGPPPGGGKTTVTKVTGGGLTWQLVARSNAQLGDAEIWRAFASGILTNVSMTATLNRSVASSLTVVSFTGVDTSGVNGAGAVGAIKVRSATSGAPSATLVTTRNNSLVFGVGNDWNHAIPRTVGPSQALVHQFLAPVDDTYWAQRFVSPIAGSGTSVTLSDVAPTADQWNLAVVEIVPAP